MSTQPAKTAAKKTTPAKQDNAGTKAEKSRLLAEARTAAIGRVLENRREEFNTYMAEEAKARGVEWKRRPTEREKREAKLRELLAEDPSLVEEVRKITGLNVTDDPDRTKDLGGDPV